MAQNDKNELFALDNNYNIWKYSGNKWESLYTFQRIKSPDKNDNNQYINDEFPNLVIGNTNVYFCSNYRLIELDLNNLNVIREIRFSKPLPIAGHKQVVISNNNEIWYASSEGLVTWKNNSLEPVMNLSPHKNRDVYTILQTSPNEYWIGGKGFIEKCRQGNCQPLSFPPSLLKDHNEINASIQVSEDEIWFSSLGEGIIIYNDNQWRHITTSDGLPSNYIRSLYLGKNDMIWAGDRTHGIMSYQYGRWIKYDYDDGFPVGEVIKIVEDEDGVIWAAVMNGGIYKLKRETLPPIAKIASAPNQLVPDARGVFSFKGYDAWNQTKRTELVYSWRILNNQNNEIVQNWSTYSLNTSALLPPLPPGHYKFEVRAQDNLRNTSIESAITHFTVNPYFWMTYSFQIPVLLSFLFAIFYLSLWWRNYNKIRLSENKYKRGVTRSARYHK